MSRFLALLPLVFSIAAVVLSALALFAGHDKGFMEDYAIARLNTSLVGHNMIDADNSTKSGDDDDDDDGGFFHDLTHDIEHKWDDIKGDIEKKLNNVTGEIADELASTLGISEWYSVHVMSACEGNFSPNATAHGAHLNTTNCTTSSPVYRLNLTKALDHEFEIGPFHLDLADLHWPDDIQEKLNDINDVLIGLFVLYVLGVAFDGLAVLGCVAGFFLDGRAGVSLVNAILACLGALAMTIAAIIVTVAGTKGVSELNKVGDDIGVHAERGSKFLIINWVAAGAMIAATTAWSVHFCLLWRRSRRYSHRHSHTKETYQERSL